MSYSHKKTKKFPKTKQPAPKKKTPEEIERQKALDELVASQLTDRQFAPVAKDDLTKQITYITARNGLFKIVKTPIALYTVQLQEFKTPIIGLPDMTPGVELLIPKLPFKYMIQILSWYRDINTKDKTEASVLFFWNNRNVALPDIPGLSQEGQLVIYCPEQVNSATLSDFTGDDHVHWMRENLALLLETHSHLPA